MSTISASTTTTTAYKVTADTTGTLVFQTGASPTTALTLNSAQSAAFAGDVSTTGTNGFLSTAGGNSTYFYADATGGNITVPGANAFRIYTAGAERFRIDAKGNIGQDVTPSAWGTNYPALQLGNKGAYVFGAGSSWSGAQYLYIGNNGYAATGGTWTYTTTNTCAQYTQVSDAHVWSNAISGTAGTAIPFVERARVDSNALTLTAVRIVISGASGIPAPTNNGDGNVGTTAAGGINIIGKGSTYDMVFLNKNGFTAGYVATGATTITTSSDERLKENNQPITGALDIVCQMRHETGNYKSDPDRQVAFLIAQDVDALFPYAVEKTDPEQMGVNYNWIIPLHGAAITELTALVKELNAKVDAQAAEIATLKGAA